MSRVKNFTSAPPRATRSFLVPQRGGGYRALSEGMADLDEGVYRFVLGQDDGPRIMLAEEVAKLGDPFAELLLATEIYPQSLRALLREIDRVNDPERGLPEQKTYLIGDGSQLRWSDATSGVDRLLRYAITRGRENEFQILVSTGTDEESEEIFLQVMAWDARNGIFNFYQRLKPAWVWSGSSLDALDDRSRGKGPFDSHINGGTVMKERKTPWLHWHSTRANVDVAIAADDPIRESALFQSRESAHVFQIEVFEAGVTRWTEARLSAATGNGRIERVPTFLRHVVGTTAVNLVSSELESERVVRLKKPLPLPRTLFANIDALLDVLEIPAEAPRIIAVGEQYAALLTEFDFRLTDGTFSQQGDTYFAFVVPEPSFDDLEVLRLLVQRNILDARVAATLLMVDFPNPIFSARRSSLVRHVPERSDFAAGAWDLSTRVVDAIRADVAAQTPDTPEHEFDELWKAGESGWRKVFAEMLSRFMAKVAVRATTPEGIRDYMLLAESRRREFRKHPIAEFKLTLPTTNIPDTAPRLRMTVDALVEESKEA